MIVDQSTIWSTDFESRSGRGLVYMIDTYQANQGRHDFHLDREQVIVHQLFRHHEMVDFSDLG